MARSTAPSGDGAETIGERSRSRRAVVTDERLLSTLQSADIVLPTTDGREIRLRRITEPTAEQKSLLSSN